MFTPKDLQLDYDVMPSPFGPLWLVANQEGLSFVIRNKSETDFLKDIQSRVGLCPEPNEKRFGYWKSALSAYFSGKKAPLEGEISFMVGTAFQQKVWRKLLEIPYGELRSYRWLAARIASAGASRAVGNACGKNPLPIVIPCHRIVRQDGALGGYTGGAEIKAKLLLIEEIELTPSIRLSSPNHLLEKSSSHANQGGFQSR